MKPSALSIPEILSDGGEAAARIAIPWMGVLWLGTMPVRFLQVHFADKLIELGGEARHYGRYFTGLAAATLGAFVLSILARAVFVRACGLGLRTRRSPGVEALKLPAAGAVTYVYTALLLEFIFYLMFFSFISIPLVIILCGLAATTWELADRPGLVKPVKEIARHSASVGVLTGLLLTFAAATFLCFMNLAAGFTIALWLARGIGGLTLQRWDALISFGNPRYVLLLLAGSALIVEPFWLAAHIVYAQRVRGRESGEDLKLWFERIRAEAAE